MLEPKLEENNSHFALGLLAGAIAGAAIALLTTPVNGEKARLFLREKVYKPGREKLLGLKDEVRVKIEDATVKARAQVRSSAEEILDRLDGSRIR